jgi:hypothetical protein
MREGLSGRSRPARGGHASATIMLLTTRVGGPERCFRRWRRRSHHHTAMTLHHWLRRLARAMRTHLVNRDRQRERPEGRDDHHQQQKPGDPAVHVSQSELVLGAIVGHPTLKKSILQGLSGELRARVAYIGRYNCHLAVMRSAILSYSDLDTMCRVTNSLVSL